MKIVVIFNFTILTYIIYSYEKVRCKSDELYFSIYIIRLNNTICQIANPMRTYIFTSPFVDHA